ncbi:MAG: hypothetical protein EOO89_14065 [Pedobacter sp.]|nr:MAG: hypothetical protein EOO89_14065 [Pedobacter sp.]
MIRHKISAASEKIALKQETGATWVLFLPEEDDHDIGLLFANYLLKSAGHKVIYLGAKVPVDSVKNVVSNVQVGNILVFMLRTEPVTSVTAYLEDLSAVFQEQEIYVAGSSRILAEVVMKDNVKWLRSIDDLEKIIKETEHVY